MQKIEDQSIGKVVFENNIDINAGSLKIPPEKKSMCSFEMEQCHLCQSTVNAPAVGCSQLTFLPTM